MSTVPFNSGRKYPLPPDIAKKLPHNLDAERAILGAVLLDNDALKNVHLPVDDFFLPQHRLIFQTMARMLEDLQAIDILTLTDELTRERNMESAGGAAYIASLADGMPKVSNVKHYAEIVKEDARRRRIIHEMYRIEQLAYEDNASVEDLQTQIDLFVKHQCSSNGDNPATVVGFESLLKRECPPVEFAIEPLLSSRGTGEIFAWRGTGKSYITTQMALDIAKGRPMMFGGHKGGGGHWPITRAYRLLYVYGEMDDSEIQERSRALAKMSGLDIPTDEQLGTMCKDYQKNWRPKISTARDRKFIEDRVFGYGYEGLILDNISTLWPTSQENQSDRSAVLAEWFNDLNQRGVWVIFLHHAGKSGEQRGDSEKEDMLSFVLKLRRPANYKPEQGLRVEVHVDKNRHKPKESRWLMPFEIQLVKNAQGEQEWITRAAKDAQKEAAWLMFKDKMPPMFIAQEVGVSKPTIYRWKAEYDENPNLDFHRTSSDD